MIGRKLISPNGGDSRPPRALRWLAAMSPCGERYALLGDLEEERGRLADGCERARFEAWCRRQVVRSLPGYLRYLIGWRIQMFKNFMKIALRNMARQPGFSLINIIGLAVGLAGCGLIFLFVTHETSYDRHWPDADRIYRVAEEIKSETSTRNYSRISIPFAPAVKTAFPAVEAVSRMIELGPRLIENGGKKFYESGIFCADPEVFGVFGFPLIEGNPAAALLRPSTIVISQAVALKYFGPGPALGKTLLLNGRPLEITGVFGRMPAASHLKIDWLMSMETVKPLFGREMENWHNTMAGTYLKLRAGTDAAAFDKAMSSLAERHVGEKLREFGQVYRYFLQPVASLHLDSSLLFEQRSSGSRTVLTLLSAAAVLILLIACFNFISLSTARSSRRAREVGIRKVVGAVRRQLIAQHLGESAFITALAAVLAAVLALAFLGLFNRLAGTDFRIPDLLRFRYLGFGFVVLVLTALGAGLYPALILSSFRPAATLKGSFVAARSGLLLRRVIVVAQFFAAALLVAGTLMIVRQVEFMKNRDLGFDKDQKLILPVRGNPAFASRSEDIKAAFLRLSAVRGAAVSSSVPGRPFDSYSVRLEEKGPGGNWAMYHLFVDADFVPQYEISLAAGRAYENSRIADRTDNWNEEPAFLVNESAVRTFGYAAPEEALGKRIRTGYGGRTGSIIGVVRDFHFAGLQQAVAPLVMEWNPNSFLFLTLSLGSAGIGEAMEAVEQEWKAQFPGKPMDAVFLDQDFNRLYQSEEKLLKIVRVFAALGLFVSCLGLLGLSAFMVEQKRKEIGIRKVLGAATAGIAARFSGSFLALVFLADLLAVPAAWLGMSRYLRGFAFRADISAWPFAAAAGLTLGIALLTVAFQSVRAARANPADSLRNE